jgi:hypothetical protein
MTPVAAIVDESALSLTERLARIHERARERNREAAWGASADAQRDRGDRKSGVGPQRRERDAKSPSAERPIRLTAPGDRLIRAERQVLLSLIAQIERRALGAQTTAETPFEVTAQGLCELFGLSPRQGYDLLRKATDRLARRWVTIHSPDPHDRRLEKTKTPVVHAVDYLPAHGRLRLYLAPRMLPHLGQLSAAVAQYWPRSGDLPPRPDWGDALRPCDDLDGRPQRQDPERRIRSGRGSGWAGEPRR